MTILQAVCEFKNIQGCSLKANVSLPGAQHPPVLVCIHGGALIAGSRNYPSRYQASLYRRAGFAVVSIDYRLAPETLLPDIVDDIRDALAWVRGEGARSFHWATERLVVLGGSAGGYLSLMTGSFTPKPSAIVSFYGYGDILGDWYTQPSEYYCRTVAPITREEALASVGTTGGRAKTNGRDNRFKFYLYCRQQGTWPEAVSGYRLPGERVKLAPFCPAHTVRKDYPPTLLLHGDSDTDVPYQQSVQMAQALDARRVENRLITVPGGGHGFDSDTRNPEVKRILEDVVAFMKQHA